MKTTFGIFIIGIVGFFCLSFLSITTPRMFIPTLEIPDKDLSESELAHVNDIISRF